MELGIWFQPQTWAAQELAPRHLLGEAQAGSGMFRGCFRKQRSGGGGAGVLSRQRSFLQVKMVYLITAVYDAAVYDSTEPLAPNRSLPKIERYSKYTEDDRLNR
jgi:hypothetical protein